MKTEELPHQQVSAEWSNRILFLSLLGIAYLTFFPFKFDFSPTLIFHRYPFLLDTSVKRSSHLDFFLNVLLFVPFGFGISAYFRKRGWSRWAAVLACLLMGAGVSYIVEVTQFYIPARDSGWEDVFTNGSGSVVGFFVFELCGGSVLHVATNWEEYFADWLSPRRCALLLAAYFAISFGGSVVLQRETRLSNWDPHGILFVGNAASGQYPWRGQVYRLQIWNRALSGDTVLEIAMRKFPDDANNGLLASYDFSSLPPYQDQKNFLPPLAWAPESPQVMNSGASQFDGKSWLSTKVPAENLTQEIKKSNQFTVHIVCAAAGVQGANGRIVSLSQSSDNVNFHLRQEGQFLVFWFRNPLSETRSVLAWYVPGIFLDKSVRDIVASYDGSDAFLYLNGARVPRVYRLGPGASLAHHFLSIQTGDLQGYVIVFETLVFLPAGVLLGFQMVKWFAQKISGAWTPVVGLALAAVLLEILLARVSGRGIWLGNIGLSLIFGMAGILLINADRGFGKGFSAVAPASRRLFFSTWAREKSPAGRRRH